MWKIVVVLVLTALAILGARLAYDAGTPVQRTWKLHNSGRGGGAAAGGGHAPSGPFIGVLPVQNPIAYTDAPPTPDPSSGKRSWNLLLGILPMSMDRPPA